MEAREGRSEQLPIDITNKSMNFHPLNGLFCKDPHRRVKLDLAADMAEVHDALELTHENLHVLEETINDITFVARS